MPRIDDLGPRLGSHPWALYQAEHLSAMRSGLDTDGFYTGMLKDDLQKWRYAYDMSVMPDGVEHGRAYELILALLNDFNHLGYDRDPVAPITAFADAMLEESVYGDGLLLELYSLPCEDGRPVWRAYRGRRGAEMQRAPVPSLGLIPRWSTSSSRDDVVQVSPDAGGSNVAIPRERVHRFKMRTENRRRWRRTVKELRAVDAAKVLGGGIDHLSWPGYEFSQHVNTQDLAVLSVTADIGWDARGAFSKLVTSPYSAYRRLRFVKFWVETLEDSVAFLNQFTSSKALYGKEAFTFSLEGFPSPETLEQAMHKMQTGSLTVEEAHRTYFFPKHARFGSAGAE